MLPLGHVAYTWAALTCLQSNDRVCDVDYRMAAVAALLPDLIDKPLSLTLMSDSGTSQGLAHTAFSQTVLVVATAYFKPQWLPYAVICASHLIADQMWKYPRTLLFPFSGELDYWKPMGTPKSMLGAYAEIATRPAIIAVELVGLGLLGWMIRKGGLQNRRALRRFLLSGRLDLRSNSEISKTEDQLNVGDAGQETPRIEASRHRGESRVRPCAS